MVAGFGVQVWTTLTEWTIPYTLKTMNGSDIYIDEFTGRCFFIEGMAASRPKRTTALQGGVRMAASRPKRTTALQGGVRA